MSAYYVSKYTCEEIDALLDGKAVPIKGVYPSLDSLKAEFPNGADGLYQTSDTGNLYVWNAKKQEWESLGNIVGPAGPRGAVIVPSVSPDGVMSFREESGEVTLPEPVNVKGPQGVSVQSARIDESGDLILTLTDAQVINAGRAIGPEGAKGATGASIDRIERTEGTGAPGSIDTYTVHLTNGVTTTFQVYNGKDGDGAGDMIKAVYDPTGKEQDIFAYSVPQTRKINKKPLSADVTLTGEDIKVTGSDETTIHTRLSEITNPNLLDNWYFANPVNQRGKISYTGTGYSIDRWKIIASPASLTLTDSGATLTRNDGNQWILNEQLDMTYLAELKGKHLSASALTTTCLVTLDVPSAFTSEVSVVDPSGVCLWVNVGGSVLVGTTGPDVTVIAVKLELGSQQTLAHLENGKWMLNEIPDYGEQLARCQRYLLDITPNIPFNSSYIGSCVKDRVTFSIPTPVTLRAAPVFIGDATKIQIVFGDSESYIASNARTVVSGSGFCTILCTIAGDVAEGNRVCDFRKIDETARFLLSAEL